MTRNFLRKIQLIWFLMLIGCSSQNTLSATQQISNEPTSNTQHKLTMTPTQINEQPTETSLSLSVTNAISNSPKSNEKILIVNQRNYYISTPDGLNPMLLFSGKDSPIEMASLSPDQTQFAYFKDNYIYIQNIETQKAITLNKEIIGNMGGNLKWSPDSTKLLMSCAYSQQPSMSVCAIDISNGQIEVLINEKNTDEICHSVLSSEILLQDISSDGTKIAYSCITPTEQGQRTPFAVYLYDTVLKTSIKILDDQTQDTVWEFRTLFFYRDNNYLLINGADQNHRLNVYLLDLKTGILNLLTHDPAYHVQATAWGNDGKSFYVHRTSVNPPYEEENLLMDMKGTILSTLGIQGLIAR